MKTVCMVMVALGITLGIGSLCASPRAGQPYVIPNSTRMGIIRSAIITYMAMHDGELPVSWDELIQCATTNKSLDYLLKEDLLDTWGEPFAYESDGRNWYIIQSSGPDRTMGTADDIFRGEPQKYVDEAVQKASLIPAVVRQETNAVQAATTKTTWSFFGAKKTPSNRTPVTGGQSPTDPPEPKTTPWKLPLLLGIIAIAGAITAWRYFRKKTR